MDADDFLLNVAEAAGYLKSRGMHCGIRSVRALGAENRKDRIPFVKIDGCHGIRVQRRHLREWLDRRADAAARASEQAMRGYRGIRG